jgi:SAM-dependent methyltransferase
MDTKNSYQDFVIKDGQLIGKFEEMYQEFSDPWKQTSREIFASEKKIGLNLLEHLSKKFSIQTVVELGCGFGDYTFKISEHVPITVGIDISKTAIEKARNRHLLNKHPNKKLEFIVSDFSNFELLKNLKPDVIFMPEITWYILDYLDEFILFLKKELPNTFLIHMLMTYEPGVQKYGSNYFTDLNGILKYFKMYYLESGCVNLNVGGSRTYFLGTWNQSNIGCWIKE